MKELGYVSNQVLNEAISLVDKHWAKRGYFKHFDPRTIDETLFILNKYGKEAKVIAGGIDLMGLMKNKVINPCVLVNIKTITGLAYITEDAEGLKIGALTSIKDIETSATVQAKYGLLAQAAHSAASPQVRNMATIGGNLCQDVRCWYYRRSPSTGLSFFCYRKGGEFCYAEHGDNRYHAIFCRGRCHAVCPSDMAPALIALEAKIKVASPVGERIIPLEEFFTDLGNVLRPNEIITEIRVPKIRPDTKQRYLKFRVRKAIDFAISSVATAITRPAGIVTRARIVLGGVAPTPYRSVEAEEALNGNSISKSLAETLAKAVVCKSLPLSMNAHKVSITESLIKRAVLELD